MFKKMLFVWMLTILSVMSVVGQDINPRGIYFNRFTGQFPGTEWFQVTNTNGSTYLLRDIYGGGWTGTINAAGDININPFPQGSFSDPNNFVIFPSFAGGPFVFTCNRVPTTTVDFPLRLFSPRPANSVIAGQWNNTLRFINPETGVPNAPVNELITVTTNGNTIRITDPGGAFFQGVFEDGLTAGFRVVSNPFFGNTTGIFATFPGSSNNLGQDLLGELNMINVNEFRASFLLQTRQQLGNQTQSVVEFVATRVNAIAQGDANGDGAIDSTDELIVQSLLGRTFEDDNYSIGADFNADGIIDFVDLSFTCGLGDINGDGDVNLLDVAPFVFLVSQSIYVCQADTNMDGAVNLLDVAPFVDLLSGSGG